MAIEFRLPDLGESTTEGQVVQVLVHEGDVIAKDQPVIELETDKALLEVPSPAAGRVAKIHTSAGKKLKVNDMIVVIEENGAAEGATKKKSTPAKEPEKPKPAAVKKAEPTKPNAKPAQEETGSTEELEGGMPTDQSTEAVSARNSAESGEDESETGPAATVVDVSRGTQIAAAPSIRRLARELGVDLAKVKGTGPGGRISQEDVRDFVKNRMSPGGGIRGPVPVSGSGGVIAPPLPDFSQWGAIERKPLSNIRKKTMEQMSLSWSLIPHVTQVDEADITDLLALRERHAQTAAEKGGKLTVTVFVLKAVIAALKTFPQLNASIDPASEELILKRYYHLGIAVDTEHGLMVPVIRDVDKKDVIELSAELLTISERARERKVTLEDLRGATFTITNLGGIGGTAFTPIIHYPEVAILGLARTQQRLAMTKSGIVTRQILPLCLSYDHRIIDGADAIRFTRKVAAMLEDPALLLLNS